MQPEISKFLFDIFSSINSISEFTSTCKSFIEFDQNKLVKRGVERELEIIGEAVNRLLKINPDLPITNARRIVNLRNLVIHSYDSVDAVIVWGLLKKDLPLLKFEVSQLLEL